MPPGCNVNDIPGNSPEDQEYEAAYDHIWGLIADSGVVMEEHILLTTSIDDMGMEALVPKLMELMAEERRKGYNDGCGDTEIAFDIATRGRNE